MSDTDDILSDHGHRPYEYPQERWVYYQEWNNALFLHWEVPLGELRTVVPERLHIDCHEGKAYISLVAFTMQKIRPRHLPAMKFISDFEEINLRTYVANDGKKGVYFINIEASKKLSAFVARTMSGLPYEKASIERTSTSYKSTNPAKGFHLDAAFEVKDHKPAKTALDSWLTERYCLYMDKGGAIYRYDIHHKEWGIKEVDLKQLSLCYKTGCIDLTGKAPDLSHYSEGVKVVAWRKVKI